MGTITEEVREAAKRAKIRLTYEHDQLLKPLIEDGLARGLTTAEIAREFAERRIPTRRPGSKWATNLIRAAAICLGLIPDTGSLRRFGKGYPNL